MKISAFNTNKISNNHYNEDYYKWQSTIGRFGGKANLFKFKEHIHHSFTVLDFGCGGGFLLNEIHATHKIGIEVNSVAQIQAKRFGIEVHDTTRLITNSTVDLVISNHALEHVTNPFETLLDLKRVMKPNAKIIFIVPHDCTNQEYSKNDINNHLYSWNAQNLGNLFSIVGFEIISCNSFQHQWIDNYEQLWNDVGEDEFHKLCEKHAILNSSYQIKIVAQKLEF